MERLKGLKIAVVHDHLSWRGGGERTAMLIALELGADFITAYTDPDTFGDYQARLGDRLKTLSDHILDKEVVRFFWMRWQFYKHRRLFDEYDVLIASSQAATEAVAKYGRQRAARLLYCHTPPRRVYDLYGISRDRYRIFLRPLFFVFTRYWDFAYRKALRHYDCIIANSQTIKDRLLGYTGHLANHVVWPPIVTERFKWLGQRDYYLSWARTDEQKRVELVVEAFTKMPDKRLIVASGGSRFEQVKNLAAGHDNIEVVGWVSDDELARLVGNCRAVIYIPNNEDAGMTPLEANAAGKPVIGVDEGGLREIISDGVNGLKVKAKPQAEDVVQAVGQMTAEWCAARRTACEQHARRFDLEVFADKIRNIVAANDPRLPLVAIDASRDHDPRHQESIVRTGVETYSYNTIRPLAAMAGEYPVRLRLYAARPLAGLPEEAQKIIPGRRFWTMRKLSAELRRVVPDCFFTPGYFLPAGAPDNSYATIHDVKFISSPEKYDWRDRWWQRYAFAQNSKRARRLFTVSNESKREIVELCGVAPDRVIALPISYDRWLFGEQHQAEREPVVFFVGRIVKKKSLDILLRAFAQFSKSHPAWRLVLAGKPGHGAEELHALADELRLGDKVRFAGYIDDEEKKSWFLKASIFVHPSETEGSAIPMFEAWDANVPAIVTDSALMVEVGGGAASFFKAGQADDLARQMAALLSDPARQQSQINQGINRLALMSGRSIAAQMLEVMLRGVAKKRQ